MVQRTNGLSGHYGTSSIRGACNDHTMYMSLMTEMKDKETKQTPGVSEHQDDWQILIWTKGSEIGMFDEAGSVYAKDVAEVLRDGVWLTVAPPLDT